VSGVVLAVDGGNSKTDVVLCGADGSLLAAVRGPTTSHQAVGLERGLDRLDELVTGVVGTAGRPAARPVADVVVACLAGLDLPVDERRLGRAWRARNLGREIELRNDTFAALRAGTEAGWGVAVICGQGVNGVGVSPDGRVARFAGLGDIAGDRGGGSGLGMDGLGAAVRATDGRGPRTTLVTLVPAHFGLRRPLAVTEALYRGRIADERVAELAPVVVGAARAGDEVAVCLVRDVADELAAFAIASIRRLRMQRLAVPVVLAGGLARGAADLLVPRVDELVRPVAPDATVSVVDAPPVLGAALLGLDDLAPGDAGAAARLRAEIRAWDAAVRARRPES